MANLSWSKLRQLPGYRNRIILRAVKGDGAEMLGAAPDGNVHTFIPKCVYLRLL